MTSNSLISLVVATTLATGVGAQPMKPERETVFAVAKVAGKAEEIDGQTYQLLAVYRDPRVYVYVSGTTDVFWSLNGKVEGGLIRASMLSGTSDSLPGKLHPSVALFWVRLPDKGELEFVFGAARLMPGEKRDIIPARLAEAGYKPFKVDVKDLPVVEAKTAKEVSEKVLKLGKGPNPPGGSGTLLPSAPPAALGASRLVAWSEVFSPAGKVVARLVTVRLPITERLDWNTPDGKPELVGNAIPPRQLWQETPSALVGKRGVFGGFYRCLASSVAAPEAGVRPALVVVPLHSEYDVTFALPADVPVAGDWDVHERGVSLNPNAKWLVRDEFPPGSRVGAFNVAEGDLARTKVVFSCRVGTHRYSDTPAVWVSIIDMTQLPGVAGVKVGGVESILVEHRVGQLAAGADTWQGFLRVSFLKELPEGGAVQLKFAGVDSWVACPVVAAK